MRRLMIAGVCVLAVVSFIDVAAAQQTTQRRAATRQAPQPPQPQPPSWTGGQVGGFGGSSTMAQSFVEPGSHLCPIYGLGTPCPETPFSFDGHDRSFTGGGFYGYRWQFGNFVAGIETDLAAKHASSSRVLSGINPNSPPNSEVFTGSMTQGWDGSVRARFGTLLTPSTLLYGTGGLAYGKVSGSYSYSAGATVSTTTTTAGTAAVVSDGFIFGTATAPTTTVTTTALAASGAGNWSDTRTGYTAGGGIETLVGGNWTARVEYRYTNLGDFSKTVPLTATPCLAAPYVCTGNARIDMSAAFHTVRFGLGLNF